MGSWLLVFPRSEYHGQGWRWWPFRLRLAWGRALLPDGYLNSGFGQAPAALETVKLRERINAHIQPLQAVLGVQMVKDQPQAIGLRILVGGIKCDQFGQSWCWRWWSGFILRHDFLLLARWCAGYLAGAIVRMKI